MTDLFRLTAIFRSAEDFEYSDLLDKAAKCTDICEQLAYVSTFTMATYSTCSERIAKPFNPLLGETYEFDRTDDMGWRLISEQVSHHPPICAQYVESKNGWRVYQQLQLESKFRGKSISAIPKSFSRIDFDTNGASYTFNRPSFEIYNIIFGKMYIDIVGDSHIVGHHKAKGFKSILSFVPQTFFSKEPQRIIKGKIVDSQNNVKILLDGHWNDFMQMARVKSIFQSDKGEKYDTAEHTVIWRKQLPPSESQLYYNFTNFACQLNEPEDGVAPTDSRLRPDQRFMENGLWDDSNTEKVRLEEIQRERRKLNQDVVPVWFSKQPEEFSEMFIWKYNGKYWDCKENQDWSKCAQLW